MKETRWQRILGLLLAGLFVTGCGSLPRNPVPLDRMDQAQIPGMADIRAVAGSFSEVFEADLVESVREESAADFPRAADGSVRYAALSISGGGDNGAFGAGFLNGWTASGTRPSFKLVTGISTGALIAPFAFLGPQYDDVLKKVYTSISADDIFRKRGLSRFWRDAFADTDPLAATIARDIDADLLEAVARAHARGRRLYIGTTHMDAGHLVVWNMGAIASSGHPKALAIFRKVMLASASVPVAFPPVLFEVEVDGERYDEMHADGGVETQMFFLAATVDLAAARQRLGMAKPRPGTRRLYVLRNGRINPEPEQVERKLQAVAGRAVSMLIKAQARGDLYRMYGLTEEAGIDFNFVDVPDDYTPEAEEPFDTAEMNRLYQIGYEMGLSGNAWHKTPPGVQKLQ